MAEQPEEVIETDEVDDNPNYKVPEKKALTEMLQQDADDESLQRYKKDLLQGGEAGIELFKDRPNAVPVKLALVVEGRPDVEVDLEQDKKAIKNTHVVIKEGVSYKIKIYFYVQREIIHGLRYHQVFSRKGITVDKNNYMVGSYPPKKELQCYTTPADEAPKGMLARGQYNIRSKFVDDDKHVFLDWEWTVEIKKDWKD